MLLPVAEQLGDEVMELLVGGPAGHRSDATMPSRSPDENFHHVVTELLRDWQQQEHERPTVVTVVGEHWDPRAHAA